jgi:hypothetical protein
MATTNKKFLPMKKQNAFLLRSSFQLEGGRNTHMNSIEATSPPVSPQRMQESIYSSLDNINTTHENFPKATVNNSDSDKSSNNDKISIQVGEMNLNILDQQNRLEENLKKALRDDA